LNSDTSFRILLLADSHLGFDLPLRPRTERRRRGHDFFANYERALEPVQRGEVDVVVHAGDVFDRPTVAPSLAYQAYEPLRRVAELGIPVLVVPGNHERSRLPHRRLLAHPNIHVFEGPRTVVITARGADVAFSGFPYERRDVRAQFPALLEQTGWRDTATRRRVLCVHHCVEGATVGPADYVFTTANDVIRHRDIPREFAAVFTGHVHRHQVLSSDLEGRRLTTPVLYPGSVERTAFAEAEETKGFMVVHLSLADSPARAIDWEFRPLPARPMHRLDLVAAEDVQALVSAVHEAIAAVEGDAVLTLRVHGELTDAHWDALSAKSLRAIAPPTMNVDVIPVDAGRRQTRRTPSRDLPGAARPLELQLPLL
jgi:DNA repair exonuclease SbcCD nuclease subunit